MSRQAQSKRADIWLSAVLYVLIVIIIMVIILEAGLPVLDRARDRSTFTRTKDTMTALDQHIVDIAGEGQGSQRVIPIEVPKGDIETKDGKLLWKLETSSKLIEPRSRIDQGNLVIAADLDVAAREYPDSYVLENSRILVNLTRFGSAGNWTGINTSRLINYVESKAEGSRTAGVFKFLVQNNETSTNGTGYTSLVDKGTSLTTGTVIAHVNTTSYEYDLKIALDSKADFFRAAIENFRTK
ncbi:hypothetical protein HYU15_00875 [Candidatus Woesearchaeota archaeon]|nr:hypothetical protein [Candidatus Woesearchaeota archaeon]